MIGQDEFRFSVGLLNLCAHSTMQCVSIPSTAGIFVEHKAFSLLDFYDSWKSNDAQIVSSGKIFQII